MEDEHWDVDGSQLAAVRVTAARALFADGNPLEAEALLARVAEDAPSPVELCLATTCLVNQRTVVGDLGGALAAGLSVLNALGIEVARGEALAARADAVEDALAEVGDISRLPEAEAPLPTAIAALLQAMVPASFFTDQELFTFAVRELVLLTCEHGVTPGSAYPLAFCGFMQAESGNPDAGRRLAEQAIVLSEGRDEPGFLCQVLFTFAHHINHWGAPVFNNVALFRAAERAGMEAGDHQWAGYAMTGLLLNLPSAARSLGEIIDECRRVIPFLKETRNDPMLAMARPVRQFARWLRGETEHEMSDAGFDADAFEAEIEATPKFVATHANLMLHGHAILGEWQEAWSRAEQLADLIQFQRGNYAVAEFELFRGIAAAERQNRELTEACAQRLRGWAERAPENFEPMALLLDGEIARLAGDAWAAMIALDGAARRAREFGHTSICALAHERAAILLDGQGLVAAAEGHALRARSAYALWGATAKVARLDEAWAPVRTPTGIHDYDATRSEDSGTDSSTGQNTIRSDVDLRNLETAGRAIANEVELLALVPRLLRVLMDVSGATRSVLLLPDDDGQLDVVAQLDGTAFERVREPLLTTKLVPRAAVERVAKWDRTRQTGDEPDTAHLVVGSALDHTWLKDDPCVAAYGVRALACVRAERGGRLIAVVYLENNLLAWAFTPERVGILHLLAAQIAAALENAVLLDRLRRETAERLRTQEQLEASQRMESIGRLAAGVAHDFNNLLNVILGWSDTLLGEAPEGEPLHEPLAQIDRAARRGAELTQQLLAFSRTAAARPRPVRLERHLRHSERMLRTLLGDRIQLEIRPAEADAPAAMIDPALLEQVLVNLLVNARDAMPAGGSVIVTVTTTDAPEGLDEGRYLCISLEDEGTGIPESVRDKVFEPFFTTKGTLGTGLGLSTCLGIIEQSGGALRFTTQEGIGTRFDLWIPATDEEPEDPDSGRQEPIGDLPTRVLIVEDEPTLREMFERTLSRQGLDVVSASSGDSALVMMRAGLEVDATATDMTMPGLTGLEFLLEARKLRPDLPALIMSGLPPSDVDLSGLPGVRYVQKPISPRALVGLIRELSGATDE